MEPYEDFEDTNDLNFSRYKYTTLQKKIIPKKKKNETEKKIKLHYFYNY